MNVRELIEALQQFDPELPVDMEWVDNEYGWEHEEIERVSLVPAQGDRYPRAYVEISY